MNPSLPLKRTSDPAAPSAATLCVSSERHFRGRRKGQALMEFAMIVVILAIMVMGLVDYGRLFVVRQVMVNASREGANLAARGTTLSNAVAAMISTAPAMLFSNGYGTIIASTVTRSGSGVATVTGQVKYGATNFLSRIGSLNASGSSVTLPSNQLPQTNQTLYVTEVFYPFTPATPVANLMRFMSTNAAMPTSLYDVTFF
ncbi:MAG: pilus assembly protein [Verrucomicrobia bacterium]|nr:pilus assembly protein [Verrucomicrobiota bacterium]